MTMTMATNDGKPGDTLSRWWKITAIITMLFGFGFLILITFRAYQDAPPIPAQVTDPTGQVLFNAADVGAGQEVFLKHGLMDNGTVWGHGGYLGPDFSAQYLHAWAQDVAEAAAQATFGKSYGALGATEQAQIDGGVAAGLKQNRYDPASGTLAFGAADAASFKRQIGVWTDYFRDPALNGGLAVDTVSDPEELRRLTAFFAWTAWASVAERPGKGASYTANFPYDPLAGNHPTAGRWSTAC